jgi:hypothetical protein
MSDDDPPHLFGSYTSHLHQILQPDEQRAGALHGPASPGRSSVASPTSVISWPSPAQPSTILVAQATGFVNQALGISRSTDGGASFQQVPFTETINGILCRSPPSTDLLPATITSSTPRTCIGAPMVALTWAAVAPTLPVAATVRSPTLPAQHGPIA